MILAKILAFIAFGFLLRFLYHRWGWPPIFIIGALCTAAPLIILGIMQ